MQALVLRTSVVAGRCHDSCRQPQTYVKPEAAITVFELLMMSGVVTSGTKVPIRHRMKDDVIVDTKIREWVYIYTYRFQNIFYVRRLDSIASYLPTCLHLGFFRSWPSLYLPSSFFSVFLAALFCFGIHFNAILGNLPSGIL